MNKKTLSWQPNVVAAALIKSVFVSLRPSTDGIHCALKYDGSTCNGKLVFSKWKTGISIVCPACGMKEFSSQSVIEMMGINAQLLWPTADDRAKSRSIWDDLLM